MLVQHRHVGRERARQLGLVGAELQHHHAPSPGGSMSSTPRPMLPASCEGRPAGGQHVVDQRGGGGLAVGARDGDDAGDDREPAPVREPQRAEEQPDVVVHRHARLQRREHDAVRRGVEVRDPRRDDERGAGLDDAGRREVGGLEALRLGPRARLLPVVPAQRLGAARACSARAAARPERPRPSTATRAPAWPRAGITVPPRGSRRPNRRPRGDGPPGAPDRPAWSAGGAASGAAAAAARARSTPKASSARAAGTKRWS